MRISRRSFGKALGALPARHFVRYLVPAEAEPTSTTGDRRSVKTPDKVSPWYLNKKRWTTFNIHYQDWNSEIGSRLSSQDIIRNLITCKANVFMMDVGDLYGNLYYPTRVGHMHPNLGEKDLVSNVVAGCKSNGISVVIYNCVSWNKRVAQHHPEWVMKDNKNRMLEYDSNFGPLLCYNSGYLDYVKAVTREMLQFDADALFYDMLWFGTSGAVCYCQENCQSLFLKTYGTEMPRSPSWNDEWRKFLEFRYESNLRFAEQLNAVAREMRPEIPIFYNYHGAPPLSWQAGQKPVAHRLVSNIATGEGLSNWFGHWYPSFLATYLRGLKPESPVMVGTTRGIRTYGDSTLRPAPDLRWEVFTYLAHGAAPEVVDDPLYDGRLQPDFYDVLGEIYAEVEAKEPYFGYEHIREVGLYYSLKSRDWYGRENQERYQNSFVGAHRALTEAHIPVDALFDETATLDQLKKYPLVFLAETAILDDDEVRMFRQYVQQGGRLLATHDTGLYDVNGNRLSEFTLGDVFGIRYKAQAEFSNDYYRLPKGPVSADMRPEWDVLVTGTANIVDSAGARPLGELRVPYYDGPPFHPVNLGEHNPPWKVVAPAIFLNRFGAGQTAYVPLGVDSAYVGEYPLPEHRLLIRNLVRYLSPNPRVRVDAPLSVEAVVTEDQAGSRYIIHFIGYQGPRVSVGVFSPRPRPFVVEEPLLYRAEIHLTAPPRAARGLSHKTQISQTGNSIRLTIEDVHESIIVSY